MKAIVARVATTHHPSVVISDAGEPVLARSVTLLPAAEGQTVQVLEDDLLWVHGWEATTVLELRVHVVDARPGSLDGSHIVEGTLVVRDGLALRDGIASLRVRERVRLPPGTWCVQVRWPEGMTFEGAAQMSVRGPVDIHIWPAGQEDPPVGTSRVLRDVRGIASPEASAEAPTSIADGGSLVVVSTEDYASLAITAALGADDVGDLSAPGDTRSGWMTISTDGRTAFLDGFEQDLLVAWQVEVLDGRPPEVSGAIEGTIVVPEGAVSFRDGGLFFSERGRVAVPGSPVCVRVEWPDLLRSLTARLDAVESATPVVVPVRLWAAGDGDPPVGISRRL